MARIFITLAALAAASLAHAQDSFYGVLKGRRLRQTSPAAPIPEPTDAWRFAVFLPENVAGSFRTPAGVTTPLAANAEFERRFNTEALLEAAFPPGAYTLTAGAVSNLVFNLPANPYPADLPRITSGVWDGQGRLMVDPARPYVLTFNTHSSYVGSPLGNVRITIFDNGRVFLEEEVYSRTTPSPIVSYNIPAGRLVAGRAYGGELQFVSSSAANTTSIPGATGIVGGVFEVEFQIIATPPPAGLPTIGAQPASRTVAPGSTVVFTVGANGNPAPNYQWRRGTAAIAGATNSTLVLSGADAIPGAYNCVVSNSAGSVTSNDAQLLLPTAAGTEPGRLINLSVLAPTGPGAQLLTMGATVGGSGAAGTLPLVIRGVGPTLGTAPFNVGGVLPDPVLSLFPAGSSTASVTNDNWGGTPALVAAFTGVGAFQLPAASLDSAALQNQAAGGFTVQVAGKGAASGTVIAEVYDAAGAARTASTPRLTNLSTLTGIAPGATLSAGFVIGGGTARTVLVRAVGPTLATAFGIGGAMADPRLEFYNNDSGALIAINDNWAGAPWLTTTGTAVGAFALGGAATLDAALLMTLPPGAYSARVQGVGGAGGTAIIEVYEVP
ncbi:MAG: immunoglobulin domain-containing protein [Opitutaceae bacterium]|nr:immunoglobulin domain-containing protein [Opitutaceae bacterium]